MKRDRKIGVALGSGGARGWCHIGVLSELEKLGVRPSVVAGCSMGAIVGGAAWAGGVLDRLEDWALSLTRQRYLTYVDVGFGSGGVIRGGRAIGEILASIGLPEQIEDLNTPFVAVATDMATGREIWLKEGSLADAVRASISIPGVLEPYFLNGRWLLDGGADQPGSDIGQPCPWGGCDNCCQSQRDLTGISGIRPVRRRACGASWDRPN